MAYINDINRWTGTGRLTRDPDLRATAGDKQVCSLRIAVNGMAGKEAAGYVDIDTWEGLAEACAKYLRKGSQIGIDGRLQFREWDSEEAGKRYAIKIVAEHVKFLSSLRDAVERVEEEALPAAA